MKGYKIQHITDEMFEGKEYENIKDGIQDLHNKAVYLAYYLKQEMGEDFECEVGEPYFLDWNTGKDSEFQKHGTKRNQYRYDIRMRKNTRKFSWNRIVSMFNNIKVSYREKI